MASLLVAWPILEKLVAHFKNLKMNLPRISKHIVEAQLELTNLLALVTKHNKYKRKENK